MAVIINDFGIPSNCMNCPMLYDQMYCSITESKVDWSNYDKSRLDDCPLKSLDDAIDDIQTNINSMKENAKLHEKGIRQNGEMIAAGLQMALDIIDSYCKENT